MDWRLTPFSGRVAHVSLRGKVGAPLTAGEPARIAPALADLCEAPSGARLRQLIHGAGVTVIDRQGEHAFVMATADGYCGWLGAAELGPDIAVTHRICSPATHLYPAPRVQAPPLSPLYLNALVRVTGQEGAWAETGAGFVPACHLARLDAPAGDPVAIAGSLLHAPYLWGGNSVAGVDCSGLVQLAFRAAGRELPGDSDLQREVGREVAAGDERRGDLVFWKGHVALVTGPDRILHANAHSMDVAFEGLAAAIGRIRAAGGGEVLARRRP